MNDEIGAHKSTNVDSGNELRSVGKSKKRTFKLMGEVLDPGGPGFLQFAITNVCNARYDFCNFAVDRFDRSQRRTVAWQQ